MNGQIELTVSDRDAGVRLDSWLSEHVKGLSRRHAQRMITAGEVLRNGKTARKGVSLVSGDTIFISRLPDTDTWIPRPNPALDLVIAYEDEHLAVVEKAANVPSVPQGPDEAGTLASAVVSMYPECASIYRSRGDGGLVQRLDTQTSGLVIVARTQSSHDRLIALQQEGAIIKSYLTLVESQGETYPPETIEIPLGSVVANGSKVGHKENGRASTTAVFVKEKLGGFSLLEAIIHRGFRHQIRAHLSLSGFPLAGDTLYGGPSLDNLNRLFLHAYRLEFPHPETAKPLTITSDLPADLAAVLEQLP